MLEAIHLAKSIEVTNIKDDFHLVQLAQIQKEILYELLIILISKQGDDQGQATVKLREIYQTIENKKEIANKIKNGVALKFQIKLSGFIKIAAYENAKAIVPHIKKP